MCELNRKQFLKAGLIAGAAFTVLPSGIVFGKSNVRLNFTTKA